MSVELPVPLRPWASSLALFPDDLALALGDLVRRLSLAFGEFRVDAARGTGEPDGFDGIARKGVFERLLTSEWLLSNELPDEFLRRVATAEVSYLKLAQREPARPRWSVALIDAGPSQLGSPRVGHIAALVTLAARAERARAKFRWALLQNGVGAWSEGLSEASVWALISGRSARSIGKAEIDAWLGDAGAEAGDLWLLGGDDLAQCSLPSRASIVTFAERGVPGATSLRVTCKPTGKQARNVELVMPDEKVTIRLIREPFAGKNKPPTRSVTSVPSRVAMSHGIIRDGNILFTDGGRRIAYIGEGGSTIVVQPIPNSPNAQVGKRTIVTIPGFYVPLACSWRAGRCFAVSSCEDEQTRQMRPVIAEVGKRGGEVATWPQTVPSSGESAMHWAHPPEPSVLLGRCYVWPRTGQGWDSIDVLDGAGRITTIRSRGRGNPPEFSVQGRAIALRNGAEGLAYITRSEPWSGPDSPLVMMTASGATRVECGLERDRIVGAFFGPNAFMKGIAGLGLLAVRYDGDEWRIATGTGKPASLWIPGGKVVGVTLAHESPAPSPMSHECVPALVVVDGRRVDLVASKFRRELFRTASDVVSATVCDDTGNIACVLANQEILVYSPSWARELLRLTAPAGTTPSEVTDASPVSPGGSASLASDLANVTSTRASDGTPGPDGGPDAGPGGAGVG